MSMVAISGGNCPVGANLAAKLLDDHDVICFSRSNENSTCYERVTKRIWELKNGDWQDRLRIHHFDLLQSYCGISQEVLAKLRGKVDTFFHVAAETRFNHPDVMQVNVEGTTNALNLAFNLECSCFVHVSTLYAAGSFHGEVTEEPFSTNLSECRNNYERSKRIAENNVIERCEELGVKYVIVRPGIIVGHSKTGHSFRFQSYYQMAQGFWELARRGRAIYQSDLKTKLAMWCAGVRVNSKRIYIPAALPGVADATLTITPIDTVIEGIIMAWLGNGIGVRIVNILPSEVRTCKWWLDATCNYFGLGGLHFVPPSEFPPKRHNFGRVLCTIEEQIARQLGGYRDYICGEPRFKSALQLSPVTIDESFVSRILDYAVKKGFKEDHL